MNTFADRLFHRMKLSRTPLVVGIDPRIEFIPSFVVKEADRTTKTTEEFVFNIFRSYYGKALEVLAEKVPAIKPNIAFFEQYGIGGLRAFSFICSEARERSLLVIGDCKRGDIGSTAEAYAHAFLAPLKHGRHSFSDFQVDALTVNPFLGYETLEPFVAACEESGSGIFVLVRTSNAGSGDIQRLRTKSNDQAVSDKIATWLGENSIRLKGACGLSGLGAVVGAHHGNEGEHLRTLMPTNLFLIPGFGAQGASVQEASALLGKDGYAGIINASRAIFHGLFTAEKTPQSCSEEEWRDLFVAKLEETVLSLPPLSS
jgi:orotidine-5'-phosphate decarboxylase